jgi:two-component system, NtrC family, sensor kinase
VVMERTSELDWISNLFMLSQSILSEKDPAVVQHQLIQYLVESFDAHTGSLALIDEDDPQQLVIVAGVDLPAAAIGSRIRLGDGIFGWVAEHGEPVLLNGDAADDPRFAVRVRRGNGPPMSSLCWPLRINWRTIGTISLNRRGGTAFSTEHLDHGRRVVELFTVVVENTRLHAEQQKRIADLVRMTNEAKEMNKRLEDAQAQLLQSEKLASIGQLAAGVAHEINNPIGYVNSNIGSMERYLADLFTLVDTYGAAEMALPEAERTKLDAKKAEIDLEFLREDISALLREAREGIVRVRKIVQDLKDFSRAGAEDEWQWASAVAGLESTLSIVQNEIKYKAQIVRELTPLPDIECIPSQLNQVFLNLLVNAAHAIETKGTVTVRSGRDDGEVWLEIEDTGKGIAPEHMGRIFDPFFTTKPVGKGTGLGLSISYGIVKKHNGRIDVQSEVGKGTRFRVTLPIQRSQPGSNADTSKAAKEQVEAADA